MNCIQELVEAYSSTFQQCLFARDPLLYLKSLPDSVEKKLMLFLFEPHSQKFRSELQTKYNIKGQLLQQIDQWKAYSKIIKAQNIEQIKYLIEKFLQSNKSHFEHLKPVDFELKVEQNKSQQDTLSSRLKSLQPLQQWIQEQLNKNQDNIQKFSKKALRLIKQGRLLKLKVHNKEKFLMASDLLFSYLDQFIIEFIKSFYQQKIKLDKNYDFPHSIYSKLSKNQIQLLKNAIPEIINKDQYLQCWLIHNYGLGLQNYQKKQLSISEKDEKRKLLLTIFKDLQSLQTIKTKSIQLGILKQIILLDISRDQPDKTLFLHYIKNNAISSSHEKPKIKQQKQKKIKQYYDQNIPKPQSIKEEDQFIKETIHKLFKMSDAEKTLQQLQEYFEINFLNKIYAKVKLTSGGKTNDYQNFLSAIQLKQLREQSQITILQSNKRRWKAQQQIQFKVKVKNVDNIHVRVYKIDLEKHFLENNKEINQTQNISYLQPNHSYDYSIENSNPYLFQHYDIKIEGIPKSRGAWIVELEGKGISTRAFIRKGAIVNIDQNNTAGTKLKFYDENGIQIVDYHIWMDTKKYTVKSQFIIPYGEFDKNLNLIITKDGYAELFQIYVPGQAYNFNVYYLYNTQSFIVGQKAKILLHPRLALSFDREISVNLKLLQKVKILVTLTNNLGVKSTIQFNDIAFNSEEDYLLQFPIQSYPKLIEISVTGRIKKYNNKDEDLISVHSIQMQTNQQMNFIDVYLKKYQDQFCMFVLGKNGQPIPKAQISIQYRPQGRYNDQTQTLITSREGIVFLGSLEGVKKINSKVNLKSGVAINQWILQQITNQIDLVQNAIYNEGEVIILPILKKQKIQLWQVLNDTYYVKNYTDQIKLAQHTIQVRNLPNGKYHLNLLNSERKISFAVVKGKLWEDDHKIYDERIGRVYQINRYQNNHIILGDAKFTKQENHIKVEIPIKGTYDIAKDQSLRVYLMATNFIVPNFEKKFNINDSRLQRQPKNKNFPPKLSTYYNNRKLSQETTYMLNRFNEQKYIGSNLQYPKMFLKRIQIRDTIQLDEILQVGGDFKRQQETGNFDGNFLASLNLEQQRAQFIPMSLSRSTISRFAALPTHNNFLLYPATILQSQKENNLIFIVPLQYSHFQCYLFSEFTSVSKKFQLSTNKVEKKNLAHTGIQQKTKDTAWTMSREVYKMQKGETIKVGRDSTWLAIGLTNIASFAKTKGFSLQDWVINWSTYSLKQKLSIYDEKCCHELNTYIKFNDPTFFETVVYSHIRNKVTKTFVDLCLIEDEQALLWTSIDKYQTLNQFQKLLLVNQLIKTGHKQEAKSIITSMQNKNKSRKIQFQQFKQQFDTVITAKLTQQMQKKQKPKDEQPWGEFLRRRKRGGKQQQKGEKKDKKKKKCLKQNNEQQGQQQQQQHQRKKLQAKDDEDDDIKQRKKYIQPFKQMERTKQYTQTTYSNIKYPNQSMKLVGPSPYWTSIAQQFYEGDKNLLTQNFLYLKSRIEFTLAFCFMPNQRVPQYELKNQEENILIQASSNFLIFVKQVKQLPFDKKFGVLLNQRFFDPYDRAYYQDDGTQVEKQVKQFVVRRPYCIKTLITNTSGTMLQLQLLIDIPEGSIPLQSYEATRIQSINIQAYSTLSFERYFYFPNVGTYAFYPANACRNRLVIAKCDQIQKINVLQTQTNKKMDSLENIMKSGENQKIIQYLKTKNIFDPNIFDPHTILWMLKNKQFYFKIIQVLRERKFYNDEFWLFGYYHNDLKAIVQYQRIKQINQSQILQDTIPIFEYFPYFSSRAHKFLNQNKSVIRNKEFKKTYLNFLFKSLFNEAKSSRSRLVFIYYLLLQDRIDQAFHVLNQIQKQEKDKHQLQFDYIQCFIDMYKGYPSFSKSRGIINKYSEFPVGSWRKMFKEIINILKQYDGEEVVQQTRTTQFMTTVVNQGYNLLVNVPSQTQVEIYLYDINLELYFSAFPFTQLKDFSINTDPNSILIFKADESRQEKVSRKADMKNCFVQAYSSASGLKKKRVTSFLWVNPDIRIKIKQQQGYAQIYYKNEKKAGIYCKVYQMKNGSNKFYRDGYTDIAGKFKYALSDLEEISEFSILFLTDYGGKVEKVNPSSQQSFLA